MPSSPALPPKGKGVPSPFGRGQGEGIRVAAVGPKTAEALRKHSIEPDFIPDEFAGVNIMSGLGDVKDKWILLPRAEIASKELPQAVVKASGIAHEIIVYRTLPTAVDEETESELAD